MAGPSLSLISALAADLRSDGRGLACRYLHQALNPPSRRMQVPEPLRAQTLLLAGLASALGRSIAVDLGVQPDCPQPPRRRKNPVAGVRAIPARHLHLYESNRSDRARPLLQTHDLISRLPQSFVLEMARWAPPVVSPSRLEGPYVLAGNVFTGYLLRNRAPDAEIYCRVLTQKASFQPSIDQMAGLTLHFLASYFDRNRDQIVIAAPNLEIAGAISGLSRSMCARIRKDSGDEPS